jgi:hypothetical protein
MKKFYIFAVVLLAAGVLGFAQAFDDLAYPNPDLTTYFQQEATSLVKFQAEHDINIPFFTSFSVREMNKNYYYNEIMRTWDYDRGWYDRELEAWGWIETL